MLNELITSGTLELEQAVERTLAANQVKEYLEREHKELHEEVLESMLAALRKSIVKQLMQPRDRRVGKESCTSYTGACPRKSRYQYDGVIGEPTQARTQLKFILGDGIEAIFIGVAQLAGVDIGMNNADLFITGEDGVQVPVHPDGLIRDSGRCYNVEVKSCDSRTYDNWDAQGGPDNTWGYLSQASVEIQAWREAGYEVNETCFVAVSTGARQGSIKEYILPYDQALVDGWHKRRALARAQELPPRPYEPAMQTEYKPGKVLDADVAFAHGEPVPRINKAGNVYGYDIPTGAKILPLACSYCSWKGPCWGAEMAMDGDKPIWIVKETGPAPAIDGA